MLLKEIFYKMIIKNIHILFLLFVFFQACSPKPNKEAFPKQEQEEQQEAKNFFNDSFSLRGQYHWKFKLIGTTQHSIHTFYPHKIEYTMKGKIHSTAYTMQKLSYQKEKDKWIGKDENGNVYVLFFKNQTQNAIEIYKRKCKDMSEAIAFDIPAPDTTADHGWNVYYLDGNEIEERLNIAGTYIGNNQEILISNDVIVYNGKDFNKLSFYQGERRWVGQNKNTYLQIFFKDLTNASQLELSIAKFKNLEKAYETKYGEKAFRLYNKENNSKNKGKQI